MVAGFLGSVRETMWDKLPRHASVGQEAMAATVVQLEMPPNAQSTVPMATMAAVTHREVSRLQPVMCR